MKSKSVTPPNPMSPEEIRARLIMKKVKQIDIARQCEVSHVAVRLVIEGKTVSRRIRQAIANVIEVPLEVIWPTHGVIPNLGDTSKTYSIFS